MYNWQILRQAKRWVIQIESDRPEKDIVCLTTWNTGWARENIEGLREVKRTWLTSEQQAGLTIWKLGVDYESDPAEVEGDMLMVNEKWTEKGEAFKAQLKAKV